MRNLLTMSTQRLIHLGDRLGIGGEATVYCLRGEPDFVAKIYHQPPTSLHQRKLTVMIANPPRVPVGQGQAAAIAWPLDLILDTTGGGRFVGFLMSRVANARPLGDFSNPRARRTYTPAFNYRYLLRTASNLATIIQSLHETQYVVGDQNESNILVSPTALVTVIDSDSLQVPDRARRIVYRCPVGKPEFTAPEIQGRPFASVERTPEHDLFAMAVLVFMLLMEGTHPMDGVFAGMAEPPPYAVRIANGLFPYGSGRGPCQPRPSAPPFDLIHPDLRRLFTLSFVDGHANPAARPTAAAWKMALRTAEQELGVCQANQNHVFGGHMVGCPWCERAKRLGRDPFPSPTAIKAGRGRDGQGRPRQHTQVRAPVPVQQAQPPAQWPVAPQAPRRRRLFRAAVVVLVAVASCLALHNQCILRRVDSLTAAGQFKLASQELDRCGWLSFRRSKRAESLKKGWIQHVRSRLSRGEWRAAATEAESLLRTLPGDPSRDPLLREVQEVKWMAAGQLALDTGRYWDAARAYREAGSCGVDPRLLSLRRRALAETATVRADQLTLAGDTKAALSLYQLAADLADRPQQFEGRIRRTQQLETSKAAAMQAKDKAEALLAATTKQNVPRHLEGVIQGAGADILKAANELKAHRFEAAMRLYGSVHSRLSSAAEEIRRIADMVRDGKMRTIRLPQGVEMSLCQIPGGTYMSATEVTQRQWTAIMGGSNPSRFRGDDLPVDNVSYHDAAAFCAALSNSTDMTWRLPSEAEWERSGNPPGAAASPQDVGPRRSAIRVSSNTPVGSTGTWPVDTRCPNSLGLYGLENNVREWCSETSPVLGDGGPRPLRGGAWRDPPGTCGATAQLRLPSGAHDSTTGFRVVFDPNEGS